MDGPDGAEHSGVLSKKKLDHGRFEDPYKQKVNCWIRKNVFYIRALGPDKFPIPGSIPEKLDLTVWKLGEREDKNKFTLIHPGGGATKLKAETQQDAENWINVILASIKTAKEEEIQARLAAENALRLRAEADASKLKAEQEKIQRDRVEQEKIAKELADQERIRQDMLSKQKKIELEAQEKQRLKEEAQEKQRLKDLEEQNALSAMIAKKRAEELKGGNPIDTQAASNSSGTILVGLHVKEVLHLPQMDRGGSCDAYAVISIGGRQRFQTEVIFDSYNAKWNQHFEFQMSSVQPEELQFEIFDKDIHKQDDYIGRVRVPGKDLLKSSEKSLPLLTQDGAAIRGKDGQITMLSIAITSPLPSPQHPPVSQSAATTAAATSATTTVGTAVVHPVPATATAPVALSPVLNPVSASAHATPAANTDKSTPRSVGHSVHQGEVSQKSSPEISQIEPGAEVSIPVKVLIKEVENLPKMDVVGTCDPYAVATLGKQRISTEVVWNSYYAKWNKEFDVEVGKAAGTLLVVEVLDRDKLGKDDLIGKVTVDLLQLVKTDAAVVQSGATEKRLPVLDKSGAAVRGKNGLITMLSLGFRKLGDASPGSNAATRPVDSKSPTSGLAKVDDNSLPRTPTTEITGVQTSPPQPPVVTRVASSPSDSGLQSAKISDTHPNQHTQVQSAQKTPQEISKPTTSAQSGAETKSPGLAAATEAIPMKLTLKDVENLPKKDVLGTCDAYAVATIGTAQRFSTDVVWNSYYAKWSKECDVLVGASVGENLRVEIYDRDKVGTDDLVGEVKVDLRLLLKGELAHAEDGTVEKRFPVLDKNGVAVRGKNGFITMLTLIFKSPATSVSKSKVTQAMSPVAGPGLQQQSIVNSPQKDKSQVSEQGRERSAPPSQESHKSSPDVVNSSQDSKSVQNDQVSDHGSAPKKLRILVKEVEHLPKKDMMGTCDAFAVISLNGKQRSHTEVVWNSFFAKWNQKFELNVGPSVGETLLVEVFDKDKVNKDDLIGIVNVDLRPLVVSEAPEDGWLEKRYPVLDKSGVAVRGKSGYITMLTLGYMASPDLSRSVKLSTHDQRNIGTKEESRLTPEKASPPADLSPLLVSTVVDKIEIKESKGSGNTESSIVNFENAVDLELRLKMEMEDIKDVPSFKHQVIQDISKAAKIDPTALRVSSIRAGSVIVDLALASEARDSLGRNVQDIAGGLEKQAKDSESELLKGKITKSTISLTVKKNVQISESGKTHGRDVDDVDAPKTANHAQKMAAKLYSENADLLARISSVTKKLQSADLAQVPENVKSSDIPLEDLVDILLKQLEDEKHARAQADAAFDLATADAMKHEAEKEEAIIDRDFLKNELQAQKEIYEEQLNELKSLRTSAAESSAILADTEALLSSTKEQHENSMVELAKSKQALEQQKREYESKVSEVVKLKQEIEAEREARKLSDSALQDLRKELELAKDSSDNNREFQSALANSESAKRDLQNKLTIQIEQFNIVEAKLAETLESEENIKAELDTLREQFLSNSKLNEDLKLRIGELETKSKEEKANNYKKLADFEEQLARAKPEQHLLAADCERLRTALASEQRAKSELEERVFKLQERIVSLQGDLDTARLERRELEAVVTSLREELNSGYIKQRERDISVRESSTLRSGPPRTPVSATKQFSSGSPAVHLFMAGALSGTPGKVAKILLGSSERHRLATSDYLASLLENTVEINRVGKGLQPEDMAEIAAYVLSHPRIERMFLSGNNLGVGGARQLADLLSRSTLKLQRLDLRHNNLGNQGCALLMESLAANESLTRLDLSANGLTSAAAAPIASAVRASRCLLRLDLRHNELGDSGATELAEALRCGARLLHLDLSANAIGMKGAEALAGALISNTVLEVLDVRGNALGAIGISKLEQARESAVPAGSRQILLPVSSR